VVHGSAHARQCCPLCLMGPPLSGDASSTLLYAFWPHSLSPRPVPTLLPSLPNPIPSELLPPPMAPSTGPPFPSSIEGAIPSLHGEVHHRRPLPWRDPPSAPCPFLTRRGPPSAPPSLARSPHLHCFPSLHGKVHHRRPLPWRDPTWYLAS
jgi:hypothetical protein